MCHPFPLSRNDAAFKAEAKKSVTMADVYMVEAMRQDSEARKRVLARMTETGSREAMLALHSTLADQMPDMTAEGGYWYALGYLEGALGLHRQEEVMREVTREVTRDVSSATYRHRQDKVEAEFGGSYQAACEAIVALREHRDQLRELLRRAKEDVKENVKEGA